jgi:phosphoglycolate phosphatase-like HAD superfamily hydrolase
METIAGLRQRGYTVAISSSTDESLVLEYLAHFGLSVDLAMGLRPGFKKGRDHFVHIQNQCRVDSGAICFVADSVNDYHIAASNGVRFIAKCGLFDQKAFQEVAAGIVTISDLQELLTIF